MPRMGRVVVPRYPHHVVQRGHNRQAVFVEVRDYLRYLETLKEFKDEFGVKVYAYCLMTNHVHLLLAPDDATGIGKLMKRLAARQTRRHNRMEGRTGTLWEGRYKSSVVQTDSYLLACCRYIELNPVRAQMVSDPASYRWSSCGARLGRNAPGVLTWDPCFSALGDSDEIRRARYWNFLHDSIPEDEWKLIREAVQRGQLTGTSRFSEEIAAITGRRIVRRGRGRPPKQAAGENKSVTF
ncbi:MAG: transposase [Gammaproteobacteria bacterium]|nr:transposase [Gammaproteobacteria bacterium]